jgi:hypothetical protein
MGEAVVAVVMIPPISSLKSDHCAFEWEYLANVVIGGTSVSSASDGSLR